MRQNQGAYTRLTVPYWEGAGTCSLHQIKIQDLNQYGRSKDQERLTQIHPMTQLVKNPPHNAGDLGSILVFGRSPREGKGYPVFWPGEFHGLYSPWGHKESDTTEQLSVTHVPNSWRSGWAQWVSAGAMAPLSHRVQAEERNLLCAPSCWLPKLLTKKYSHNMKVESFLFGADV